MYINFDVSDVSVPSEAHITLFLLPNLVLKSSKYDNLVS